MDKFEFNFGMLIAYLVPGFLGLYGIGEFLDPVYALLGGDTYVPEVAAVVPIIMLSLAVGGIINAIGWALVRPLIAFSGAQRPQSLDYTKIKPADLELYNTIIESNFRYHQFYVNTLVAIIMLSPKVITFPVERYLVVNLIYLAICVILFLAARDSLKRAYSRMCALSSQGGDSEVTNGEPFDDGKRTSPEQKHKFNEKLKEQSKEGKEEKKQKSKHY